MKAIVNYLRLMRFHKPTAIFLLLWPALSALWIAAGGWPGIKLFLIFVLGTVIMRSAGDIINDYADRDFDGFVDRTKQRPLATGAIKPQHALILFFILCLLAFILVLFLNLFTICLAFIGVAVTIIYPFTKRFFPAPQAVLGIAYAWGVPMGFAAVQNHIPLIGWELFIATFIWIVMYDTQYAMVDREDDKNLPIHSTALLFGKADKLIIGLLQLIFLSLMVLIGLQLNLTIFYYMALFVVLFLFIYQQVLIKDRVPANCFKAFLNNNWVGMVIFLGIIV